MVFCGGCCWCILCVPNFKSFLHSSASFASCLSHSLARSQLTFYFSVFEFAPFLYFVSLNHFELSFFLILKGINEKGAKNTKQIKAKQNETKWNKRSAQRLYRCGGFFLHFSSKKKCKTMPQITKGNKNRQMKMKMEYMYSPRLFKERTRNPKTQINKKIVQSKTNATKKAEAHTQQSVMEKKRWATKQIREKLVPFVIACRIFFCHPFRWQCGCCWRFCCFRSFYSRTAHTHISPVYSM